MILKKGFTYISPKKWGPTFGKLFILWLYHMIQKTQHHNIF